LKFQKNNNIKQTTMQKKYNEQGERIYADAIKRENAKKEKIKQNKTKQI